MLEGDAEAAPERREGMEVTKPMPSSSMSHNPPAKEESLLLLSLALPSLVTSIRMTKPVVLTLFVPCASPCIDASVVGLTVAVEVSVEKLEASSTAGKEDDDVAVDADNADGSLHDEPEPD